MMAEKPAIALLLCFVFLFVSLSEARSPSDVSEDERKFTADLTEGFGFKDKSKILLPTEKLHPQRLDSDASTSVANLEVADKAEETGIVDVPEKNLPASNSDAAVEAKERSVDGDNKQENVLEVKFRPVMQMMNLRPAHRHAHWAWMSRRFWFPRRRCGGRHRHGHGPLEIHHGEDGWRIHRLPVREINTVPFLHHRMREGAAGEEGMMIGEFKRPHFGFFQGRRRHHRHHHGHHHDEDEFSERREAPRRRFGLWKKLRKFIMTGF